MKNTFDDQNVEFRNE